MRLLTSLSLVLGLLVVGSLALRAPADSAPTTQPGSSGQHGPGGYHLLPPPLMRQLNLSDDQKQQLAQLESDTKAKLATILTADQQQALNNFRPPRPNGQAGQNGQGQTGQNGQSGQGGQNGMTGPGGNQMMGGPSARHGMAQSQQHNAAGGPGGSGQTHQQPGGQGSQQSTADCPPGQQPN